MNPFSRLIAVLAPHPRLVSTIGALSGWLSFDWLRAAQFLAAFLASLVSLCALILTAPKALAQVRRWLAPR